MQKTMQRGMESSLKRRRESPSQHKAEQVKTMTVLSRASKSINSQNPGNELTTPFFYNVRKMRILPPSNEDLEMNLVAYILKDYLFRLGFQSETSSIPFFPNMINS